MLRIYLCWRGGDRGNLSVVLSPLMINWLPSTPQPPSTPHHHHYSSPGRKHPNSHTDFQHVQQQWNVGRERTSDWNRAISHKVMLSLPPFFFFPEIVAKHKQCREIVLGQARTGYHLGFKFKQVFKTSQTQRDTANWDVSSLLMGLSPGENATSLSLILKL